MLESLTQPGLPLNVYMKGRASGLKLEQQRSPSALVAVPVPYEHTKLYYRYPVHFTIIHYSTLGAAHIVRTISTLLHIVP